MKKPAVFGIIVLFIAAGGSACYFLAEENLPPPKPPAPIQGTDKEKPLHEGYAALLKKYVKDGSVNYGGLKKEEAKLDAYLSRLNQADPGKMKRNGRLAFWINAYNAFTLKLILKNYPGIESIKDISSSRRWKWQGWFVKGKTYSLDRIEHEILRKMKEPRIHFAIVCASKSCPDLADSAYLPEKLDEQLTAAARRFLANDWKGLKAAREKGAVWGINYNLYLSKIFSWFAEDFGGSIPDFVAKYAPKEAQAFIKKHKSELSLKYFDYDWSLNGTDK